MVDPLDAGTNLGTQEGCARKAFLRRGLMAKAGLYCIIDQLQSTSAVFLKAGSLSITEGISWLTPDKQGRW